jgi:DNA polymerase I-like protein with 3'-5' exonuclease and polymerase domains
MNSPDKLTLRCEVLSLPKQVRETLKTSECAEQVALGVQAQGPGAVGATLAGVSFCFEPSIAYHAPLGPEEINSEGILQELRPLLSADGPPKVMHDAKPGLMVLAQRGVKTGTPAFDTLLAAFLLDGCSFPARRKSPRSRGSDRRQAWPVGGGTGGERKRG